MLTEQSKEEAQIQKLKNAVTLCEEAIAKAEKYERLNENKDWQGFLEDLRILAGLHEKEIKMAVAMIPDAPNQGYLKDNGTGKESYTSSKSDWVDFISRHEIQRTELQAWIKEPDHILALAAMSREKLPILKKNLKELSREPVTSGNGVP